MAHSPQPLLRKGCGVDVSALYLDAQNGGATRMQKEEMPNAVIVAVLRLAFAAMH